MNVALIRQRQAIQELLARERLERGQCWMPIDAQVMKSEPHISLNIAHPLAADMLADHCRHTVQDYGCMVSRDTFVAWQAVYCEHIAKMFVWAPRPGTLGG